MKVYGQLEKAQLENLPTASAPVSPPLGYAYFDTTLNQKRIWDGSAWTNDTKAIIDHAALTAAHGVAGAVVGTTSAQVLTNKDIDGGTASNTNRVTIPKDTLANLQALTRKEGTIVYATDTDKFYADNGSTLVAIGSGGGGSKNYAVDDDSTADGALGANWGTFDDSAYPPVDGSGGTVTATLARTTSSPLQGAGSILFTPGGQYDASKFSFTIDRADFARMFQIKFDYEIGTYASYTDGDVKLAVICASDSGFTTDLQVIQPAGHSILKVAGQETHVATFQTHVSNLYYRVCLVQTTAATGYTLKIDNWSVGPQSVSYGCPVSDWNSYTPTFTNFSVSSQKFFWRRVGDSIEIKGSLALSGAPTGALKISIPSGMSFDTAKLEGFSGSNTNYTTIGTAAINDGGAGIHLGLTIQDSSSSNTFYMAGEDGADQWNATVPITFAATDEIKIAVKVPILGWSSNVLMSDSADTRGVAFFGAKGSTQAVTANVTDITLTAVKDSHGAWSGSALLVKVPGDYIVNIVLGDNGSTTQNFEVYKNGSQIRRGPISVGGVVATGSVLVPDVEAGDTLSVRSSASTTIAATGGVDIYRLSGPAQIAASEEVYAGMTKTSGSHTSTGNYQDVTWDSSKQFDSHGFFDASTGVGTFPRPGRFKIHGVVSFGNNATGVRAVKVYHGATTKFECAVPASSTGGTSITFSALLNVITGDTFKIATYQSSGGSLAYESAAGYCVLYVESM